MSRALSTFLISFGVIVVIAVAILGVFFFVSKDDSSANNEPTIDEMIEHSLETEQIVLDLADGNFVRVKFMIVTDGKKAKEEIEKRNFQIENILIKEISKMTEEDFSSGLENVETTLQDNINEVMTDGEIIDVYTIEKILQ